MYRQPTTQAMRDAARTSQECETICLDTVRYCLHHGGPHVEPSHMTVLLECAEICETAAKFLSLGSFHDQVAQVCAAVCDQCAINCERFTGDAQMKACADLCRLCAAACRRAAAG